MHSSTARVSSYLAPPYLLALLLLRLRIAEGRWLFPAAAVGIAVFAWHIAGRVIARGTGRPLPEQAPLLVWGGVAALELHAFLPAVAATRVVPAALFFALGYGLRNAVAVPAMVAVAAWIPLWTGGVSRQSAWEFVSLAALCLVSGGAGAWARARAGASEDGRTKALETIAESRSLVLPWEEPPAGGEPRPALPGDDTEEAALLRRGMELSEGIRNSLERLLPLIGAAHAAYLAPAATPGSAFYDGQLVSRGQGGARAFSVPDTYVPVREATVFRRPFLEEGDAARLYALPGVGTEYPVRGIVTVPVLRGEAVEGVLLAVREDEGEWPDHAVSLVEMAAFFVGRDIERTRLLAQGERYLLRQDWYHRMVRTMAQLGGEDGEVEEELHVRRRRVYSEAVGQLRRQVGASRALLIGTSDAGRTGWITWEETDLGAGGSDVSEALEDYYAGWVIRTGSRRIVSEGQRSSKGQGVLPPAWSRERERSFLLLPVAGVGGFRGAVVCCHEGDGHFHRQHAEIARDITEVMQLGLSHVAHLEMLTKRAETDALTGLFNRKTFLRKLEAELSRLDGRAPLAVIMMDIDHFKRINDTYGHPFGDEVLRKVSTVLGKAIRRGDGVGRYGGEEFVLFLSMTDPVKAVEGAERFRRMIRQTRFLNEGKEVAVTASFGVSCGPMHGNRPEELLKRADEALYLSKRRGRDRVTLFPG